MIRNLKFVNAYREFQTTQGINAVRNAVQANMAPNLTPAQTLRFNTKYLNGDWSVTNHRLRYTPSAVTSLLVAYPHERTPIMTAIWNDRTRGYGLGLQAFYAQISLTHLNIQKKRSDAFLRGKADYEVAKVPVTKVIRPIRARTITVGTTNGLAPAGQAPLMRGVAPWEFAGNQLTHAGNVVTVHPKTIPRVDQINARN